MTRERYEEVSNAVAIIHNKEHILYQLADKMLHLKKDVDIGVDFLLIHASNFNMSENEMTDYIKHVLKAEYLENHEYINKCLKNDADFGAKFLEARQRNSDIFHILQDVLKMSELAVEALLFL